MAAAPLLLMLIAAAAGAWGEVRVSVPEAVEAELTQSVMIPCTHTVTGPHASIMVEWFVVMAGGGRQRIAYWDRSAGGVTDGDTDLTPRVTVDGAGLTLTGVKLTDERSFLCQVTAGVTGSNEGSVRLQVYDAPEPPEVTVNPAILSMTEQLPSEIGTCISRNGFPAPTLTWYKDGAALPTVTSHNEYLYETPRVVREASGLYTVSSRLFLKLNKGDKDAGFSCRVGFHTVDGDRVIDSDPFSITLHYHSERVTFALAEGGDVKEGDKVQMKCSSDGFPPPEYIFYRLMGDGEEQELGTSRDGVWVLPAVMRNDSGPYRCEALDFDAPPDIELKKDLSLFVHYLQTPEVSARSPLTLPLGHDLEVTCSAQGSAPVKIIWRKGKDHLSHSPTLTLKKLGYKSSGTYMCEVSVPSVRGLVRTRQLKVLVEGKPSLESGGSEVRVEAVGQRVTLTCAATAHPPPKISWSIDKQPVVSSRDQAVVSKVSLPVSGALERSGVTCNASNRHGWTLRSFTISIVPPTTETPLTSGGDSIKKAGEGERVGGAGVVVTAVVVSVLLLLLLVCALYCLHKRGKLQCGQSGRKEGIQTEVKNDNIVVEMKSGQNAENSGLLGSNPERRGERR